MTDGPKRHQTDPNFRLDEEDVKKLTESNAPPPNLAEAMREGVYGPRPTETLVHCPHCEGCALCGDARMVLPKVRRTYLKEHAIDLETDPDEGETR